MKNIKIREKKMKRKQTNKIRRDWVGWERGETETDIFDT